MIECPYKLRADIPAPPPMMRHLPIDKRGYPVPWFVMWVDGEPEFRAMDRQKFMLAMNRRRCWVCGGDLFREEVYTIGPMCAINRISGEPPSHRECAEYSARACPFLTKPHMVRREDEAFNSEKQPPAGIMIARNPGVTLLWYTRRRIIQDVRGRPGAGDGFLFQIGRPFKTEWYCQGRPATRAEVMASIDSGYPLLKKASEDNDGPAGTALLECQYHEALRLVPKA
jgi:hypothetical protein